MALAPQNDPGLVNKVNNRTTTCSGLQGPAEVCQVSQQNFNIRQRDEDPTGKAGAQDCQEVCGTEFGSQKYYFSEDGQCYCGDVPQQVKTKSATPASSGKGPEYYAGNVPTNPNVLTCAGKEMIKPDSSNPEKPAPGDYFKPLDSTNDPNTARCGCDSSMAQKWKCAFGGNPTTDQTISKAFDLAVSDAKGDPEKLYAYFNKHLGNIIGTGPDEKDKLEKLKALVAHEVCRFYNVSHPRVIEAPSTKDPKNWIKYYFGKMNNLFIAILVFMIVHILFRTLIPKGGDFKDSLLYAMSIPKELLSGSPGTKFSVMAVLIVVITTIVGGLLFSKANKGESAGKLLQFYIPTSISSFLTGGIAFSIYAVLFAVILGRELKSGSSVRMLMGAVGVTLVWTVLWAGSNAAIKEQKYTDALDPTNSVMDGAVFSLFILAVVPLVVGALGSMFGMNVKKFGDWSLFLLATGVGIIPLAVFFILLNVGITVWAPMAELALLVLYRMMGVFWSFNPKGFGNTLLSIMGVRPTDKWVLPFLPWVTLPIQAYYALTGETLPGYFTPRATSTGVSNTNMWLS